MVIFTNKDIKKLFIVLTCILGFFSLMLLYFIWWFFAIASPILLLLIVLADAAVLSICFIYHWKQNKIIENAIIQVNLLLSGDTAAYIECDKEGSLYKLFHSVNTLSAVLSSQLVKEHNIKEFQKNTISDISHQLKTPLAALNIYNGLLQDETIDKASAQEFIALSEQELDRIETLVQNLLKITKLDAGSIIIEKYVENVADMMKEVEQHFTFRAKQEEKTISFSGQENATLFCDRDWMLEAVSNIVKNALDHTKAGDGVQIEWKYLPTVTQIIVKDNGTGIHPEDIHHIFKRFYRSRFQKDTQGIGLGLPLAKAIVEAHNGNITATSVLGKGSVFVISCLNISKL